MLADVLTEPLREVAEGIGDGAAYNVTDVADEASGNWSSIRLPALTAST
jgi:hypothetical protein